MSTKPQPRKLGPVEIEYLSAESTAESTVRGLGWAIVRCRRWKFEVRFPGVQSTTGYGHLDPGETSATLGWVWLTRRAPESAS